MTTPDGLALDDSTTAALAAHLPQVARQAVDAIESEIGEYADQLTGDFRLKVQEAVRLALGGLLALAGHGDAGTPLAPVLDAAYALGAGEARSGRSVSGLLAAYRVGARVAWQDWSAVCVDHGMPSVTLARFAALVFSYIDALSAASVTGHTDQLARTGRSREQQRERLGLAILEGRPIEHLLELAGHADWPLPEVLTAVVVRTTQARSVASQLGQATLVLPGDVADLPADPDASVLLAPGHERQAMLDALRGTAAVVGPTRPWTDAATSLRRARRLLASHRLFDRPFDRPNATRRLVDADEHLVEVVLGADDDALRDLRERALRPLAGQRPDVAERLADTLRSWLLHQGRREAVAADLVVHPQTVRYRMTQLRTLFGAALTDPERLLELTVALAVRRSSHDAPDPVVGGAGALAGRDGR